MYMRCPYCGLRQLADDWCHGCGLPALIRGEQTRKLHLAMSTTRPSPEGKLTFELGAKVGYWPCLKGPFASVSFGFRRLDLWYGLPPTWQKGKAPPS